MLQAHGAAPDALVSFDNAAEHLEKQLRRYKRRLKDHHKSRQEPVKTISAATYVIAADGYGEDEEPGDLNPVIIAESSANVPELSVGEAVMQLDISTSAFLFFRTPATAGSM